MSPNPLGMIPGMSRKLLDYIIPVFIIAVSIFLYADTFEIPAPRFEPLGSAFFPRVILIGIIFLSIILLCQQFIHYLKNRSSAPQKSEDVVEQSGGGFTIRNLGTIFLFGLYIFLISVTDISYLFLTFAFTFVVGWFLAFWRLRALPSVVAVAISVTAFIYLVFGIFLGTFFP